MFESLLCFFYLSHITESLEPTIKTPIPYQFDPRIHSLGNVGTGGVIHSLFARPFTKLIDVSAYDGTNIREKIINDLEIVEPKFISDFGCGTGTTTEAIRKRFKKGAIVYGVDSSKQMLQVADIFTEGINYVENNIEHISFANKQDLITCTFTFHEIPQYGRLKILKNMKQNLNKNGQILIVDIDPMYKPSEMMQHGEPFINDYIANIDSDILSIFPNAKTFVEVQGHVRVWICN